MTAYPQKHSRLLLPALPVGTFLFPLVQIQLSFLTTASILSTRFGAGAMSLLLLLCFSGSSMQAQTTTSSPAPVSAQTPEPQDDDHLPFMKSDQRHGPGLTEAEPPSVAGLLARTFGALLVIIGLIVAGTWGLRRFGRTSFGNAAADAPALAVLSSVSLGDRRTLSVVRFGDATLLVGSTPQGITLLATEKNDDPEPVPAAHIPTRVSVADLLEREEGAESRSFARELSQAQQRETHRNG